MAELCYCGSMAEQFTRNEQVVGSIPTSSSKADGQVLPDCLFYPIFVAFGTASTTSENLSKVWAAFAFALAIAWAYST